MENKKFYRQTFWKTLPPKSYKKLLVAIFFIFSTMGFINDLWNTGQQPFWRLLITIVYFGIMGIGLAHITMRRDWKIVPVFLIIQFCITFLLPESSTHIQIDDILKNRLIMDGLGIFISIFLGYLFFIIFISGEGIPQVRLKTEIDLAKGMHDVLVPPIHFQNEKFIVYGKSIPTSEVGGDLLDLYETENSITCYVADVSGHGVAAGLLMGMFKSSVHTALLSKLSLSSTFNTINRSLHHLKKANMFLTASAIRFDESKTAEFTIAGHLPILYYRAHSNSVQQLLIKQIPLSITQDFQFKTEKVDYNSGDIFLFLTDGLTEVINSKNEEFGINRIEKLLEQNNALQSDKLFDIIINEINHHGSQFDDQTLLIIRCN